MLLRSVFKKHIMLLSVTAAPLFEAICRAALFKAPTHVFVFAFLMIYHIFLCLFLNVLMSHTVLMNKLSLCCC